MFTKKGFTIVELVVVCSLILMVVLSLLPVFTYVSNCNKNSKTKVTALAVASGVIEEARALNYDELGTVNGNPSGNIPQTKVVNVDGVNYSVQTLISWKSATGKTGINDIVAFKEAKVVVSAVSPFSNLPKNFAEITTSFAREGQTPLVQAGHLRFKVVGTDGNPISVSTDVNINNGVGLDETLATDYEGVALFGIIPAGTYTGKISIPDGYLTTKNETIDASGRILRTGISVLDWQTTEEKVLIDRMEKFCTLSISFIDSTSGEIIKPKCLMTGNWNNETNDYLFDINSIGFNSYDGNFLSQSILGKLWPLGTYQFSFANTQGYEDFSMQSGQRPKFSDGSDWNGLFLGEGQSIPIKIYLTRKAVYFEDSFASGTHIETMSSSNSLIISTTETPLTPLLVAAGSNFTNSGRAFDNDSNNYASGDVPKSLIFDVSQSVVPSTMAIRSRYVTGYTISGSNDLNIWSLLKTLAVINSIHIENITMDTNQSFRYYKLNATTQSSGSARIYEIDINSKKISGYRISNPIPLGFTFAPTLKLIWNANIPIGGEVKIYSTISSSDTEVPIDFTLRTSGENIIAEGTDITNKYLWLKQELSAGNNGQSPTINWLRVDY